MAEVAALTGDDGVDVASEAVGTPATFTRCIALAGFAGRVVHVGHSEAPVTYETQAFNLEELDTPGSHDVLETVVAR